MNVQITDQKKEEIDHILRDFLCIFQESKIEKLDWEIHNIREMLWREIFFKETLGNQDQDNTDIFFGEYFQSILSEKDISKYEQLEKLLINISKKHLNARESMEEMSVKISEIVSEREKIIEEGNKNYEEASSKQSSQKELDEEEEKLEKEWDLFEEKNSPEIDQTLLNTLIEKQNSFNLKKENFFKDFSKYLNKENEIKEEVSNYTKQIDKYHVNWAKLNKELSGLIERINHLRSAIADFQNQKLIEKIRSFSSNN